MRRIALLLLCLVLPCRAGDDDVDRLVDRLFAKDPAVRAAARERLLAAGEGTLAAVLKRLETRQPAPEVLRIYETRDLQTDAKWWKLALARIRQAAAGEGRIEPQEGSGALVVTGSAKVHERVAAALAELRRAHGRLVTLDVRVVRLPAPAADLPAELAADAVAGFLEQRKAEVTSAPQLTCRNGQEASIEIVQNVSFVQDFDIEVGQDTFTADPVVGVMQIGVTLSLRPVLAQDGTLKVATHAWRTTLDRPIPTLALPAPVAGGKEMTIQVPETRSTGVSRLLVCRAGRVTVVDLGDGHVALVAAARLDVDAGEDER